MALQLSRPGEWSAEAPGSIPTAISHLAYGTPLGAVDSNVRKAFWQRGDTPLQDLIAKAATLSFPKGDTEPFSTDGGGIGPILFTTLAMSLFGMKTSSIVLMYLAMVCISCFAFVWRYHDDEHLFLVPLYFLVVTVMLITPLGTSMVIADQLPVGGFRYFSLAAFLPFFHIFVEFLENGIGRSHAIGNLIALLVQGAVLSTAIVVRNSPAYLLFAFLAVLIWQIARHKEPRHLLILKSGVLAAPFAFWALIIAFAAPAYVRAGRVFGVIWHRVFISLGVNPEFPFGDLQQVSNCTKYIPRGLVPNLLDRNGHCVWLSYPPNLTRPFPEVVWNLYGPEYEGVLRDAFFSVLAHYPRQTVETFLFYKSFMVWRVLGDAIGYLFPLYLDVGIPLLSVAVIAQLALFVCFAVICTGARLTVMNRGTPVLPLLFVLSIPPFYLAWAQSYTAADAIFLTYACLVLVVTFVAQTLYNIIAYKKVGLLWRRPVKDEAD